MADWLYTSTTSTNHSSTTRKPITAHQHVNQSQLSNITHIN